MPRLKELLYPELRSDCPCCEKPTNECPKFRKEIAKQLRAGLRFMEAHRKAEEEVVK